MIVYGDHARTIDTADRRAEIDALIAAIATMSPGLARHTALVEAFVALGQLTQAVGDCEAAAAGEDVAGDEGAALMAALTALARAVLASWDSAFARLACLPHLPLVTAGDAEERLPEGYAFYALYPEAVAVAARRLRFDGEVRIIGLRSIGTGLAAMAAAALGAPPPVTLRPIGHPFARIVRAAPALAAAIDVQAFHVIVDEGPGLSGSSFAAAATWLRQVGVPGDRIALLPSNPHGPGQQASVAARTLWATAQHPVVPIQELLPSHVLPTWVETLTGPLVRPLDDLSGGRWRRWRCGEDETCWPDAEIDRERLKFLATDAEGRRWLVKFAGLGEEGSRKLGIARIMAAAGHCPEPLGLVHGFLVERWEEGGSPALGEDFVADAVARYLIDRAGLLPHPVERGATPHMLRAMMLHNVANLLGDQAAADWGARLRVPRAEFVPMLIDGRLDAIEWIATPDGRLKKADALDHHRSHDLIGVQDIAWDVAGAIVELDLVGSARELLLARLADAGLAVPDETLAFLLPCYIAFRLGSAHVAEQSSGNWPQEAARIRARKQRYLAKLDRALMPS